MSKHITNKGAWTEELLGAPSLVRVGDRVFTSTLFPRRKSSIDDEVRQVLEDAIALLEPETSSTADVTRTRLFYVGGEVRNLLPRVHGEVFDSPGPAMSAIEVECLPGEAGIGLEVEAVVGSASNQIHFRVDDSTGSSGAVRIGDTLFAGQISADGSSHGARMGAVYADASALLREAGMSDADVASTRHYYAYEASNDGAGKGEFMASGEPTSAGIAVVNPGGGGKSFALEFEAVAGSRSTRNHHRTGRSYEVENHYSRAVRCDDVVFVAGTTSIIPGEIVQHPGMVAPQVVDTLEIIQNAVEQLGASWDDLVRTRTYIVGGPEALHEAATSLRSTLQGIDATATLLGVPVLGRPDVVVEIEATAVTSSAN